MSDERVSQDVHKKKTHICVHIIIIIIMLKITIRKRIIIPLSPIDQLNKMPKKKNEFLFCFAFDIIALC